MGALCVDESGVSRLSQTAAALQTHAGSEPGDYQNRACGGRRW